MQEKAVSEHGGRWRTNESDGKFVCADVPTVARVEALKLKLEVFVQGGWAAWSRRQCRVQGASGSDKHMSRMRMTRMQQRQFVL
jgi:hypothetical protein